MYEKYKKWEVGNAKIETLLMLGNCVNAAAKKNSRKKNEFKTNMNKREKTAYINKYNWEC